VNTTANIQILDESDYIDFSTLSNIPRDPIVYKYETDGQYLHSLIYTSGSPYSFTRKDFIANDNLNLPFRHDLTTSTFGANWDQNLMVHNWRDLIDEKVYLSLEFSHGLYVSFFKAHCDTFYIHPKTEYYSTTFPLALAVPSMRFAEFKNNDHYQPQDLDHLVSFVEPSIYFDIVLESDKDAYVFISSTLGQLNIDFTSNDVTIRFMGEPMPSGLTGELRIKPDIHYTFDSETSNTLKFTSDDSS
jgi:hypothetical protein